MIETKRLLSLIDELVALDVFDLTIAGGEPFLHPDIYTIIDHSLTKGLQLGALTNGVLLNAGERKKLLDAVAGRPFILQISLDSDMPEINDLTRGKGAAVVAHIDAMAQTDVELQLSCVLNRHNIDRAHLLIDRFYPHVKRFHFLNIQRTERTLKHPELLVGDDEAKAFWLRLREHAKSFPDDLFLPSLRIMMRSYGEEASPHSHDFHQQATFDCASCSVGLTKVEIDSSFNVLGCDIAKDFSYMGNVKEESFAKVWNSDQAAQVRNAPYPLCYNIKSPAGVSLRDQLRPEYLTSNR